MVPMTQQKVLSKAVVDLVFFFKSDWSRI